MNDQYRLIDWESTPDYEAGFKPANERRRLILDQLHRRGFSATYLGEAEPSWEGGSYHCWLNASPVWHRPRSAAEAVKKAAIHGRSGYWTIEQLEAFADPDHYKESELFWEAMWDLGFRPHQIPTRQWVRRRKDEEKPEKDEPNLERVSSDDFEHKYAPHLVQETGRWVDGQSFDIRATTSGMIFISGDFNPFHPSLFQLGASRRSQSHLATKQDRCQLTARNLLIVGGHQDGDWYVAIKVEPEGKRSFEVVWPHQVSSSVQGYDLRDDLEEKIGKALRGEYVAA